MSYQGYLYSSTGGRIFPSPKESPGKYKKRPQPSRSIRKAVSDYDHAELVSLSTTLAGRIPILRAAIRDKNSWAFSNWLPVYLGEDEKWGEAAEEYLVNEVLPNAFFRELRQDFAWGLRMSGMGLDMHGDDLAVFTEDEDGNPKLHIVPAPLICNGAKHNESIISTSINGKRRDDGTVEVMDGQYKGASMYNGLIRQGGRWVAARVLGWRDNGEPYHEDIPLSLAAHYACELEFFGQGRGLPRIAASVLHWMKKEEIDDQFLKGLALAAQRAVIHKLAQGKDAMMSLGNALTPVVESIQQLDAIGNARTNSDGSAMVADETVWVETTPDGNVQYIGADEDLSGINFENPHPNAEAFAVRILMESLADLGWSWSLTDTSMVSRAPTRLETSKANNSMSERQLTQEPRSIRFFQHAIAKGMDKGRIPKNRNGTDPYKWGVGFSKELSVDVGNDVKADIERLRSGLTTERIIAAKEGYIAKHILRQREKEIREKMTAADRALQFAKTMGHTMTFEAAMALFYQQSANPPINQAPQQAAPKTEKP